MPTWHDMEMSDESPHLTSARATGVDVTVTDVSFSYTTASDEEQYRMFSHLSRRLMGRRTQSELRTLEAHQYQEACRLNISSLHGRPQ